MVSDAPPPDPPRTERSPVLAKVPPEGVAATEAPLSIANVPALAERPLSAPLTAVLLLSATMACAPNSVNEPSAAMLLKLPLPNSRSATPDRLIEPSSVLGGAPATLSVPPAPVWPTMLIEPVLASDCALTVTGAVEPPNGLLPIPNVPLLVSVPWMVSVLPPELPKNQ